MNAESWTVTDAETLELDGVTEVKAYLVKGRVDVIATDSRTATVEVSEVTGPPLNISFKDGTLKIEHLDSTNWLQRIVNFNSSARAVVSVMVPTGTAVTAATVSGDGMVSGSTASTSLKTVSGSLMADATEGMLTADTVSGEIIARDHAGHFVAKSVSGEITASGALDDVRANTVSGNLNFDIQGSPRSFSSNSVSGDVTVRVPAHVGLDVSSKSASGTIVVDNEHYTGTAQSVRVNSGPGSPRMITRTTSVSGNVTIVHAEPVHDAAGDAGGVQP
ncbi:DUF4097 family beta strand repeat-containing protein [Specibacter cremeus]|uniref:DUF4097 family beta strand repeat-containing protein n=1 Tax=Specibacter cremeus TaxID=1629051 RepID=UPI000F77A609|nr:DUF4097 family beta strand repeat-containing protein [Specibacter cremeus]